MREGRTRESGTISEVDRDSQSSPRSWKGRRREGSRKDEGRGDATLFVDSTHSSSEEPRSLVPVEKDKVKTPPSVFRLGKDSRAQGMEDASNSHSLLILAPHRKLGQSSEVGIPVLPSISNEVRVSSPELDSSVEGFLRAPREEELGGERDEVVGEGMEEVEIRGGRAGSGGIGELKERSSKGW